MLMMLCQLPGIQIGRMPGRISVRTRRSIFDENLWDFAETLAGLKKELLKKFQIGFRTWLLVKFLDSCISRFSEKVSGRILGRIF